MIVFVILHYQNYEVTIECIQCLQKFEYADIGIVVVDNASPNGSMAHIEKRFSDKHIHFMHNKQNEGFANGNNKGYAYAKNVLTADCIVVMNSDVFIKDISFLDKLNLFNRENSDVAIACPDIINKEQVHQNPLRVTPFTNEKLNKWLRDNEKRYIACSIPILSTAIYSLKQKQKQKSLGISNELMKFNYCDFVPHGACLIFLKNWIKNEDIAFLPVTFLFGEEDLLYDYARKNGYKICFCEDLIVNHLEDASQNYNVKNIISRKRVSFKRHIKSIKIIIDYRRRNGIIY